MQLMIDWELVIWQMAQKEINRIPALDTCLSNQRQELIKKIDAFSR